jgi:predicted dehydrogenase
MAKVKVGIIGTGMISEIYCTICSSFEILEIVACADLDLARAEARARQFHIPRACTPEDLLEDPAIDLVVNLTVPQSHAAVSMAALQAGKSVYVEKPLSITLPEARALLDVARSSGLLVGCAPDTFLGAGLQTCRALIDEGVIGDPVAATAFMMGHGPEGWHASPEMFYDVGGGPMFDMGPYYLTALVALLGPVQQVTGATRISFPERTITSQAKYGQKITVRTPTHVAGLLNFASGPIGTIITSFDVWGSKLPRIEIYGSRGSLSVPDPNTFGGPVLVLREGESTWNEAPLSHGYAVNSRGVGIADMAYALRTGRPHRANGDLAYHVLEIMHGIHQASAESRHYVLASSVVRPEPLPPDFPAGEGGVQGRSPAGGAGVSPA